MRWTGLGAAVSAAALAGGLVTSAPAFAARWQQWTVTYPGQAKVSFQLPTTWKSSRWGSQGFQYRPPSNYFYLTVQLVNINPWTAMNQMVAPLSVAAEYPVTVDGLTTVQARHQGKWYTEYIRTIGLPDGSSVVLQADIDPGTRLGSPGQIWHDIVTPLLGYGGIHVLGAASPSPSPSAPSNPSPSASTVSGSTFQGNTPVMQVTVTGPLGSATTWAVLDTGNESGPTITPALAQAIGLTQSGTTQSCGVNSCTSVPYYSGLSIEAGNATALLANVSAAGWQGFTGGGYDVQVDIGPGSIPGYHLHVSQGRWTLTWSNSN
ncbi:MAG: hypothetical protein M0Z36_12790 [Thermaerobacter sp.]|nr:hypothetical protein [Thermaerobacter sp.]